MLDGEYGSLTRLRYDGLLLLTEERSGNTEPIRLKDSHCYIAFSETLMSKFRCTCTLSLRYLYFVYSDVTKVAIATYSLKTNLQEKRRWLHKTIRFTPTFRKPSLNVKIQPVMV